MRIRLENWKSGKQFVIRDEQGRIVTRRKQKGSKLTKRKAIEQFKEKGTLRKDSISLRTKKRKKTISDSDIVKTTKIGQNSFAITTTEPRTDLSNINVQVIAEVTYGNNEFTTYGYSMGGNSPQAKQTALKNAFQIAKNQQKLNYEWIHEPVSETSGFFISPTGKKALFYKVRYLYRNYYSIKNGSKKKSVQTAQL